MKQKLFDKFAELFGSAEAPASTSHRAVST